MADVLYEIEAANPELAVLLRRVKGLHAVLGGTANTEGRAPDTKTFEGKRAMLLIRMHNVEELCEARDNSGLSKDSRDYIRMKYQIERELKELQAEFEQLTQQFNEDARKRAKKIGTAELMRRKRDIQDLAQELNNVFKVVKGYKRDIEAPAGAASVAGQQGQATLEQIMSGQLPKRRIVQEEMTGAQEMQLSQIHREHAEQDDLLDELSNALDALKETTLQIKDELDMQNVMLEETEQKMDRTQTKMDKVNDRMADALKLVNSKSTQFCMYMICFVILLGLLTVLFNMVK